MSFKPFRNKHVHTYRVASALGARVELGSELRLR